MCAYYEKSVINYFSLQFLLFLKGINQKPEFFFRKQLFQNKKDYIQNVS